MSLAPTQEAPQSEVAERISRSATSDRAYKLVTRGIALIFGLVLLYFVWSVLNSAWPVLKQYNIHLLTSSDFSVGNGPYGALTLIVDTLITTGIALVFAVPIGIGTALAILYSVPERLRSSISAVVELLAAVPSVVYGLWGIVVFNGVFKNIFHQTVGLSIFLAGLVLAIMILPTMVAISKDVLAVVPRDLLEGGYSLGATRSRTITKVIVPTARVGILGAVALSAGRALGETIAVAMVIGFNTYLPHSIFSGGSTLASMIAVKFGEATTEDLSALACLALMLMIITAAVNFGARLLTRKAGAQ